jgi:hypothetical protein
VTPPLLHFVCAVASAADFGRLFDAKLGEQDNAPDGVVSFVFGIHRQV